MNKNIRSWVLAVTVFSLFIFVNGITGNNYYQYQQIDVKLPAIKVFHPDPEDIYCLALNIYFEARNQKSLDAKASVGYVVLNRVNDKNHPDSICDVIQKTKYVNGKPRCQFSWYCDATPNVPNTTNVIERKAWQESKRIAVGILEYQIDNPIQDATMYHTKAVDPYWADHYEVVATIGSHIFYR